MPKRIALFFDGTWNTPDDNGDIDGNTNTNVRKLHDAVRARDSRGVRQVKWYDEGLGTQWWNRVLGGAFGVGLSRNIQQGYRKLVEHYEPGDEIFIFGFSRGAYTARSLAGLVRNAGIVDRARAGGDLDDLLSEAYALYRARDEGPDSEVARSFRGDHAHEADIHFLGVWDTVGALGVPLAPFDAFSRRFYEFHDTRLSQRVRNAVHALAVDEHRELFEATLWDPERKPGQHVRQMWFAGAHANVGGGYARNRLSELPLHWMGGQARKEGLAHGLRITRATLDKALTDSVVDSYGDFLHGAFRRVSERYYRPLGATRFGEEWLHESVERRKEKVDSYLPKNRIAEHLRRGKPEEELEQEGEQLDRI